MPKPAPSSSRVDLKLATRRQGGQGRVEGLSLAVFSAVLSFGCSAPPPPADSFTKVYSAVIAPSCGSDYCHYNGVGIRFSALDMSSRVIAYWNLVDQPCAGPSCSQMGTRVVPFQPEASLLYQKISQTMPPCGSQMPADPGTLLASGTSKFSGTALSADQQQLIYNWISDGAEDN